jgi:putative transposase
MSGSLTLASGFSRRVGIESNIQMEERIFGTSYSLDNKIKISMDGCGRTTDNIYIERLWRSVKQEKIYLNAYETGNELYRGLKTYF